MIFKVHMIYRIFIYMIFRPLNIKYIKVVRIINIKNNKGFLYSAFFILFLLAENKINCVKNN